MEVYKVTLSTKLKDSDDHRVVTFRKPLIADTEAAIQIAGKGNSDNEALLGIKTQKELIKILLVTVDGVELKMSEKEQLDKYFSMQEYNQLKKVIQKLMGSDEGNVEPQIEFSIS